MGNMDMIANTWVYIVGIVAKPDANVPEGMVSVDLPETRYAIGTISGTEPDIYAKAHDLTVVEMTNADLQFHDSLGFEIEWYDERFCPDADPVVIDLYVPVL
jgi:predicted transcriptional regulator YdeE